MKQVIVGKTTPDWPNIEIEYEKEIELFIDSFLGYDSKKDSFKILYIKEAEAISPMRSKVIARHTEFDAILTFDEEILRQCPNARLMLFGTGWVHDYKPGVKNFSVSNLTGNKEIAEGHHIRKKIHYKQDRITVPKDFYISKYGGIENFNNNKVLADQKEPMFNSQFHICIENSQQNNYFTEKLVDCLATKTIPIHWGCPNIGNFFDESGILVAKDFNDIIQICNSLDETTYNKMLEHVEKNFEICQKYITIVDRLFEVIKNILKKPEKLQLKNVTLVAVSSVSIEPTIKALEYSCKGIDFADVILITDVQFQHPIIRRVQCNRITSIDEYSRFMFHELHKYINTDFALTIQYDGFVVNPDKWTDEFFKYDFIGAPWPDKDVSHIYDVTGEFIRVGNGGFALRSKKLMEAPSKLGLEFKPMVYEGVSYYSEDGLLVHKYRTELLKYGIQYAPVDLAYKFSREYQCDELDNSQEPFGFHKHRNKNAQYPKLA